MDEWVAVRKGKWARDRGGRRLSEQGGALTPRLRHRGTNTETPTNTNACGHRHLHNYGSRGKGVWQNLIHDER